MVILINCMVDVIPRVNRAAWMGIHIESAAWAHFFSGWSYLQIVI